MRFSLRIHPSNQVLLLHIVFVIRILYPLQYYISLSKNLNLSSEPMWQMTYEKPYEAHINQSILVFIDSTSTEKASASLDGWVKQTEEAFLFASYRNYELNSKSYSLFRLKTQNAWVRMRMMTVFAYKTLSLHTDWIVFAHDDTFIIIDELKRYFRTLNCDEKHVAIIGTRNFEKPRQHVNPIYIFSRGAFKDLAWKLHQDSSDCGLSDSLWTCLKDVSKHNLDMDDEYRYRYFPMNRHFSPHEMTEYIEQHGLYDDGFQIIHQLSRSLLSFHSLEVDDLRVLDVLLNRIRVWRQ